MPKSSVLVNPLRNALYEAGELYDTYDTANYKSYQEMFDFKVYRDFVAGGKYERASGLPAVVQTLHDGSIMQSTRRFIYDQKIVAFMGGHNLKRDGELYKTVAQMAKHLAEKGFLIVTGGGPGAMEGAHLGALLADLAESEIDDAIAKLTSEPGLPSGLNKLVSDSGQVDEDLLQKVHRWIRPALDLSKKYERRKNSLGIPTWHYGHEPSTPLATHIAKYFQNSIREDGMLAIATHGVIYVEGMAGTLQEIFQDAAQNYYSTFGFPSPMIFYGSEQWANKLPVKPLIDKLFEKTSLETQKLIHFVDSKNQVYEAIEGFKPPVLVKW